jgi:UDP-N-acetylglucosamine--N-acetylmuramyl-(pentapeptide) pyrophosphoryl-undecaprenol N-acetylglucosamine transferase
MADELNKTVLLAGGGTGGHLYPGIAVAEALRVVAPQLKPVFLCTKKEIDRVILEPSGFEFIPQPVIPWKKSISGTLRFARGLRETWDLVRRVIRERKPLAVLGLGGYAAGLAVRMAAGKKIPTALINPDVVPGAANKMLFKRVDAICCQFPQTADYLDSNLKARLRVTGCPIRSDIRALPSRAEAAARLGLDPRLNTLVVTGASLGAQTVNEAVITMLGEVTLRGWQILHLSGRDHAAAVRAGYRELSVPGSGESGRDAVVIDFTPAMADVWAVADLAISRSGASSCAELTACGIPSILLPYPYHKDMHQRANAKVLADAGAAVLIDDEKDRLNNSRKLQGVIEPLLYDADKRRAMSEAARKLGKPDAAENVAHLIRGMAQSGR